MEYWKILRQKLGHQQLILPATAGAVVKDNSVLLVFSNTFDCWTLPGGLQDLNESIDETIVREFEEELALQVVVKDLVSVYSSPRWTKTLKNGDVTQSLLILLPPRLAIQGRGLDLEHLRDHGVGLFLSG